MRYLKMTIPYIEATWASQKLGTTRDHPKAPGKYELISGGPDPFYSGIIVEIESVQQFTFGTLTKELEEGILQAENFKTLEEYKNVLLDITNRKRHKDGLSMLHHIPPEMPWWFHPYRIVFKPSKLVLEK